LIKTAEAGGTDHPGCAEQTTHLQIAANVLASTLPVGLVPPPFVNHKIQIEMYFGEKRRLAPLLLDSCNSVKH